MNNQTVCEYFVQNKKTDCIDGCDNHNSTHSLYVENGVLFSYGSHYPLAIRLKNGFAVNCSGYSNSTAKHTGHFHNANNYSETVPLPTKAMQKLRFGDVESAKKIGIEYQRNLEQIAINKQKRARLAHTKKFWSDEIVRIKSNIKRIKNIS